MNRIRNSDRLTPERVHESVNAGPQARDALEIPPNKIRERAYEIYRARRGAAGDSQADWLRAERELKAERLAARRPEPHVRPSQRVVEVRARARGEALLAQQQDE